MNRTVFQTSTQHEASKPQTQKPLPTYDLGTRELQKKAQAEVKVDCNRKPYVKRKHTTPIELYYNRGELTEQQYLAGKKYAFLWRNGIASESPGYTTSQYLFFAMTSTALTPADKPEMERQEFVADCKYRFRKAGTCLTQEQFVLLDKVVCHEGPVKQHFTRSYWPKKKEELVEALDVLHGHFKRGAR